MRGQAAHGTWAGTARAGALALGSHGPPRPTRPHRRPSRPQTSGAAPPPARAVAAAAGCSCQQCNCNHTTIIQLTINQEQ